MSMEEEPTYSVVPTVMPRWQATKTFDDFKTREAKLKKRKLLREKARIKMRDDIKVHEAKEEAELHAWAVVGDVKSVAAALRKGDQKVNQRNKGGRSLLHEACAFGQKVGPSHGRARHRTSADTTLFRQAMVKMLIGPEFKAFVQVWPRGSVFAPCRV